MHFTPTTITTKRLTLRWFTPADAEGLFAIFSHPAVVRYWSSTAWSDMSHAHTMIEETLAAYASGEGVRLAVILNATGEMVGQINLHHMFHANRRCEVGYALAQAHWGKGYATEALEAAFDYAFGALNLNRIEADIDPRNGASETVLKRFAFRQEGYLRERWMVHGEVCDTAFFGLIKSDWEAR